MKKSIVGMAAMAAMLLMGCGAIKNIDTVYETGVSQETVNAMVAERDAKSEGSLDIPASDGVDEEGYDDMSQIDVSRGEPITDAEGHYLFNPFVKSDTLAEIYPQEYWDAMFNLVDALRNGRDTFECGSADAFSFAKDPSVWGEFFPVACILYDDTNGDVFSYEDGVGKIYYPMSVEDFFEKEKAFEEDIEGILRESVKAEYNDYEKALFLYDYVTGNFAYDNGMVGNFNEEDEELYDLGHKYGTYYCFKNRSGICSGIAAAYVYLLHQCGVDAFTISNDGGSHRWVYLKIDGVGYYSDPTWGIRSDDVTEMFLDYFLFSNQRRSDDYPIDTYRAHIPESRGDAFDFSMFSADDERYDYLRYTSLQDINTDENIVTYTNGKGQTLDYQY